eukprot:COSAG06_NODE_17503_length_937_cov_17.558473_2_plen_64_part_00
MCVQYVCLESVRQHAVCVCVECVERVCVSERESGAHTVPEECQGQGVHLHKHVRSVGTLRCLR